MTKVTEKIQQLADEISNDGLSGFNGVYLHLNFTIHHNDIDVAPSHPVKMDLKDTMWVTNQLKNSPRVVVLSGTDPVICRCLVKRGAVLDYHVTCSSVQVPEELEKILTESKVYLDKFARDCGFTPGTHYYNILDALLPWELVRTVDIERSDEGWI